MLTRLKRKVANLLGIQRKRSIGNNNLLYNDPITYDKENIIIKKDYLREYLPEIQEMAEQLPHLIPKRKVTNMSWNGATMTIKGYFYLDNIPLIDEDLVRKSLIFVNMKKPQNQFEVSLKDVKIESLQLRNNISSYYEWAGFTGKVNFATFSNNKPLYEGQYLVHIKIEVFDQSNGSQYKKIYPLGNIQSLMHQGFQSAKMEYFSAKKQQKFNLLATYDSNFKTMKITSTKLKEFDPSELSPNNSKNRSIVYRIFNRTVFPISYKLFCMLPLKKNKVLFTSDSRSDLSGNFHYVYEEMIKRELHLDYHFMLKSNISDKRSYKNLIQLAYHLATSKFILLDDFYPEVYPLKIRKHAELIQLWHAVGAFKTFGYSRIGRPGGPSPSSKNHKNYTKAIVSSKNVAKHYAEGFGIDIENIAATGIPRTDIFFDKNYQDQIKAEIYEEHPYLRGKKIITFAPTFRGNGQQSAHFPIDVLNLHDLYNELKDEYVFIFKIHPFVKNDFTIPYEYSDFFYNFSDYREINDLLFVTDILITDYSSVCFEFALLNKPMLFFAFDILDYVQKRDFYYDYHSFIPGPLVRSTSEIIETIQTQNFKMQKIKPFVKYFFDDLDGKSSARVVDRLILQEGEDMDISTQ
ncbi:CDP-glycerol glycerophosphotransferase family protein [Terrilactibacillus laevilacticus]|uniref:CDP-glycerol glycerophosphotransferase family protein n=1 Tax=Terrilactibacillus laevilacticus TaxID=1380157 RepID=UPI0011478944|nr:CDP-glycerol glycerophosphotransferase family protein [Terrilactibacillus laevilacticus]